MLASRVLVATMLLISAGCASTVPNAETRRILCPYCEPEANAQRLDLGEAQARIREGTPLVLAEPSTFSDEDLLDLDIRVLPLQRLGFEAMQAVLDGQGDSDPLRALRHAESHYLGHLLASKLQQSGFWGLVRINPYGYSSADLELSGQIEQSDGQVLRIRLEARDSNGVLWLSRQYSQTLPPLQQRSGLEAPEFPFEALFNAVANDLAATRVAARVDAAALRNSSTLKFASKLAPAAYGTLYREGKTVARLPAYDDPVFQAVQNMRTRNETFLDVMQTSYAIYVSRIEQDYLRFLDRSRRVTGQVTDDILARYPGITRRENMNMNTASFKGVYTQALGDMNQPIEEAVAPLSLDFRGRTAELTGTLEDQFLQWQEILLEMYELEIGASVD